VVDNGTRPDQQVITGVLRDIAEKTMTAGLRGPSMVIIGTVVTLRENLAWFGANARRNASG